LFTGGIEALIQKGNQNFHKLARENKVILIGGTHYNTEKWAVRDVARFLDQNGIPARFVEDPVLSEYEQGSFIIREQPTSR
jgi:hypothetical protein